MSKPVPISAAYRAWAEQQGFTWSTAGGRYISDEERTYWQSIREAQAARKAFVQVTNEEEPCWVCDGLGWVMDTGANGERKSVPCPAPNCPARQKAERERYARLSTAASIPDIYKDLTFAKWQSLIDADDGSMNGKWDAYMAVRTFCAAADKRHYFTLAEAGAAFQVEPNVDGEAAVFRSNSIVFTGKNGVGKTSLAVSIAHHLLDDGRAVVYTRLDDFFEAVKKTFQKDSEEHEAEVLDLYRNAPVLVIDELTPDRDKPTEWQAEKVHQLVNARYTANAPTIITTNTPKGRFEDIWGATVNSRVGTYHWLEVLGKVLRPRSAEVKSR